MFTDTYTRLRSGSVRPKRAAFSLAETAAALLIICFLATTMAPSFYRLIDQFRISAARYSARTTLPALVLYWDENHSFENIRSSGAVDETGGPIYAGKFSIGAELPEIEHVRWYIKDISRNSISIEWDIADCRECRGGLKLDIKEGPGYTYYPEWDYYQYE